MVFVPLNDDNPRLVIAYPYIAWTLALANVLIYVLFQSGFVFDTNDKTTFGFGLIPALLFGTAELPADFGGAPAYLTLITSQFLHGDILHLLGNVLFIIVFADNIEDSMGHIRFLVFYLLCGVAGALVHAFAMPDSPAPLIGASGAISGVVAAYLLLHPRVKMWVLLFARIPLKVTAFWIILLWVAVQLASALVVTGGEVGWWAHIGGFLAGVLLIPLMKRRDVPWFGHPAKTL